MHTIADTPMNYIRAEADSALAGITSRREFLTRATALGVSVPAAYSMLGLPALAETEPRLQRGGILRLQNEVLGLRDPRTFDRMPMANLTRGWLEYLVEYAADGSFRPMLLEAWEVNADATRYTLRVRPDVTWNNGDPFTAGDVALNIARWCDTGFEGNVLSNALGSIVDSETGQLRAGAVEVLDKLTLVVRPARSDITLIPTFSQYQAGVVHRSYGGGNPAEVPIGTGPYLPTEIEVGIRAVLERNTEHDWWGYETIGGAWLDRIEFLDYGTDPVSFVAAAEADEIDMLEETVGGFIEVMDTQLGWAKSQAETAQTIVIRANQMAEVDGQQPYSDVRVRRALARAIDPQVCLELGYNGLGTLGENHHVSRLHPEYADIGPAVYDPVEAARLMAEAGMSEFTHELVSIDDDWRRLTCDAAAAQWRDAGFKVERSIIPGATFWNNWTDYPLSATNWSARPLGVQVLALAYKSGVPWNESGFSNARFDALLDQAVTTSDAEQRRQVMAEIQQILVDEGVIIQPYWRSLVRHHKEDLVNAEPHPTGEVQIYRIGYRA
ncbi:MAG: ABC transporter substrate-binding protein [Pseudomonadota bacterium]